MTFRWRRDEELEEEIDAHLALDIQGLIDAGMSPDEARRVAHRRFGSRTVVREHVREGDPFFGLETFLRDVVYGVRSLRRNAGFAFAAALSLALGIAVNTVIFSLLDKALLSQAAVADPGRLVVLWNVPDRAHADAIGTSSIPRYTAFHDEARSFESVGAFNGVACGVRTLGFDQDGVPAERIIGQTVSPSLFHVLGVPPLMGRTFTNEEDVVDHVAPVIVISHRMWERRFHRAPDILGTSVTLNRVPTTIIGVMPATFDFFGDTIEFFAPLCLTRGQVESRVGGNTLIARLKPGATITQAQADLDALAVHLEASAPAIHAGIGTRVESLQRARARMIDAGGQPSGDYGAALLMLQGAVACVLLIACANVAGLLLARTAGRRQEIALRLALGAANARVMRQFLAESLPLAVAGGLIGVALSWAGLRLFVATAPPDFPRLDRVALDLRVLGFTALVVTFASLLFAIVPALQASNVHLVEPLRGSSQSATGADRQRLRRWLVAGQMALALVLLIGAGLMVHSFARAISNELGANPAGVLTFDFRLPPYDTFKLAGRYRGNNLYDVNPAAALTFDRVYERLQRVPGVVSAAAVNQAPFGGQPLQVPFVVQGRPAPAFSSAVGPLGPRGSQVANYFAVTAGYFATLGIPLRQGRDFDSHDTPDHQPVVIINETMARQYFANEDPLGQLITLDIVPDEKPREVVGVVGDLSPGRLEDRHVAAVYLPQLQQTPQFVGAPVYIRTGMYFVLRTTGEPMRLVPSIKQAVAEVDHTTPVAGAKTIEQTLDADVRYLRLYMLLLGIFGAVAAALAATGIYGVMACLVAQRTREIGIRMALGARPGAVLVMIGRQAGWLVAAGVVVGLVGALALTRVLQSMLYGVSPTDPITYAGGSLLLALVAVVACLVPARRAAAIDPTIALRQE